MCCTHEENIYINIHCIYFFAANISKLIRGFLSSVIFIGAAFFSQKNLHHYSINQPMSNKYVHTRGLVHFTTPTFSESFNFFFLRKTIWGRLTLMESPDFTIKKSKVVTCSPIPIVKQNVLAGISWITLSLWQNQVIKGASFLGS